MTETATASDDLRDLYRELILDHARSPRHFGKLPEATHSAEGINPLCGDKLKLYFVIENCQIIDARFEGSGCAISVASASLLTETLIGHSIAFCENFLSAVTEMLSGSAKVADQSTDSSVELGKLRALEGVKEFPSRVKCATLAWHALNSALQNDARPATTE